jgi:hypothetical protein
MREEEMNCKEICELLTAYLDGEVTPEEKTNIEAHLPGCPQCCGELEALSATQASLRGALKTMAEEVSLPAKVWEQVQARLDTKGGWLDGLRRLLTSKTWQVATATAAVIVIAVAVAIWQFGGVSQAPPPVPEPTPTPVPSPHPSVIPQPALELEATTEQTIYMPGETIEIELTFINMTDKPITISPFPPEIEIILPELPEGEDIVNKFAAGSGQVELEQGGEITHTLAWDQRDSRGQPVAPGYYNLNIDVNDIRIDGKEIGGMGVCAEVLIQFPQGAMEKTIELDQPQTVSGLTITLKRIEMSATAVKFYAFTIPPDYHPPETGLSPHDIPYLEDMYPVHASYKVDGATKDAGSADLGTRGDGITLDWAQPYVPLDPVPSDATELIFTIPRFGDWEGPWVFKVPLE